MADKERDLNSAHKQYEVEVYEVDPEDSSHGRKWKPGFRYTFPYFSCAALVLIIGIWCGLIAVIFTSNHQNVEEWDAHSASISNWSKTLKIPVNVWISGFVFFAGKLVALVFAEAVTIAWWVRAMNGRALRQLAHDFDASRSITTVLKTPKLFSWICLASIAFTGFSGLGMILQKATGTETKIVTRTSKITSTYATRPPLAWSGKADRVDGNIPSYTEAMGRIIHGYQQKSPINLRLHGCNATDGSICRSLFPGIGFQFDCSASTGSIEPAQPHRARNRTLWSVGIAWYGAPFEPMPNPAHSAPFKLSIMNPEKIDLRAVWKNETGCDGPKLAVQTCTLSPALVNYPIESINNVTTLRPATTEVEWSSPHDGIPLMPADEVKSLLSHTYTSKMEEYGPFTTWGGVARLFSDLWASDILYYRDTDNSYNTVFKATNLFASMYQVRSKWQNPRYAVDLYPKGACYNTFDSPMADIAEEIRQIMFRISVEVARQGMKDRYYAPTDKGWTETQAPPVKNFTDENASVTQAITVYKSDFLYLWLGIGLMMLAVAAILPLFWHFWKLGRKVSLSPLELATALHTSSMQEKDGSHANVFDLVKQKLDGNTLSNADTKELITAMGDIKVKYGQVAPQTLGLAVDGTVKPPNQGESYR